MKICCIYRIRNLVNNKSYIGKSTNFESRKKSHINLLRNNSHDNRYLQFAFNKYGEINFKFEIILKLSDNIKNEEISLYERNLIDVYGSFYNRYGYNLTKNGEGHRIPIKVYAYNKDGTYYRSYESISEATFYLGRNKNHSGHISVALDKSNYTAFGFIWRSQFGGEKIARRKNKDKKIITINEINKELFNFLKLRPGYIKRSKKWLSEKIGCTIQDVSDTFIYLNKNKL